MRFMRVFAVMRKESLHIVRDPRSLTMGIAIPILLMFLFGYALTLDIKDVPLVVWDQGNTPESREFISRFTGSPYFLLSSRATGYQEIERVIDMGKALVALILPPDFAGKIASGGGADVQLILDGSDSNTATIALGYAEVVASTYSMAIAIDHARRMGGETLHVPLDVRPRVWFNPELESKNFIVPGLIAVIMMVIAALLTSLTIAREWETGTMEQVISTPLKGTELILGKLIPYFGIGMMDLSLVVFMGRFLFGVPIRGNAALLFAIASIFLGGVLSLGMLISIVTKNQLIASQLAIVSTFLPTIFLSGFVFSIKNMPRAIQVITYLIPARYFIVLMKGIYLKGIGLEIMGMEAFLLILFAIVTWAMANRKFKKRMV